MFNKTVTLKTFLPALNLKSSHFETCEWVFGLQKQLKTPQEEFGRRHVGIQYIFGPLALTFTAW
jgi:hypothetical protein